MIISGVGSRETPRGVLKLLVEVGKFVREQRWFVRSGHADGADYAFESGARENTVVYLPWRGFGKPLLTPHVLELDVVRRTHPDAFRRAVDSLRLHPAHGDMSRTVEALHRRNYLIVHGVLTRPSDIVLCWAKRDRNEAEIGGTGQAVRVAKAGRVPVVNLVDGYTLSELKSLLLDREDEVKLRG